MTQREVLKYLWDVAEACQLIVGFAKDKTFGDYVSDVMLRSAVERQFEIIGEALSQALRLDHALAQRITDARKIIAFRNRLIHGYATVAHDIVWQVVETDVPVLRQEVDALLGEAQAEDSDEVRG